MPLISANGNGVAVPYTVDQVLHLGNATVNFARLQGAVQENLLTRQMSGQRLIGEKSRATRSIGLMTCASVIYVFADCYFVYHAPSGDVRQQDFVAAKWCLGSPNLNDVVVIYAHNDAHSNDYEDSLQTIRNFGIQAANLIEIEHLKAGTFGINNLGQLGY